MIWNIIFPEMCFVFIRIIIMSTFSWIAKKIFQNIYNKQSGVKFIF